MANETVRDVCAEMCGCDQKYYNLYTPYQVKVTHNIAVLLRQFADRIEAASKRDEREADCTNCDYANVVAENERLRAALDNISNANDNIFQNSYEYIKRLRAAFEKVLELAGCLTNMSIVDYVHYKATHATMKFENGHLMQIEDPVIHRYKLIEEQMIPVFLMLKDAVREAQRIAKEGEAK